MKEFEKKMEKVSAEFQEKIHFGSLPRHNFEAGAIWAHKQTIKDCAEFMFQSGFSGLADAIEQHFVGKTDK